MVKQAFTQRSFVLGQPREEFLEAADLDLSENSLRLAENVRIKASRTLAQRHGTDLLSPISSTSNIFEIRPADGLVYALHLTIGGLARVLDEEGLLVWSGSMAALTDAEVASLWVEPFAHQIVIGTSARLKMLTYAGGTFTLGDFAFDSAPGAGLAQPYWSFVSGVTLTPSAITGSVTVTASAAVFSAAYVGTRIRYASREILITGYTSPTVVTGTVVSQLPPTFRLSLTTTAGFAVNDVLVGQTTDFRGLIVGISGSNLDVLTLDFFDGPDVSEKVSASSATAEVLSKTVISPAASPIWDEPLISPVRGYPRSGTSAAGRLFLCDFPQAPDVIVASSTRAITDLSVGDEDDDAIARAVGDNRPRFLHVINAGDVLIFADRGCYLIALREGNPLTPATFNPIAFDARGCTTARPAKVDDGVVFIEAGGSAVAAATLSGNIYLKWSVRTLSTYHDQMFDGPLSLCGPPPNCALDDKYLFVINADGTMNVMSWVDNFDVESVGFVRWSINGQYIRAIPIFGTYWFYTNRTFDYPSGPLDVEVIERLSADATMDCEVDANGAMPSIFNGALLHIAGEGWYGGTVRAGPFTIPGIGDYPSDARAGLNFVSRVMPWPKKLIQHPKAGLMPCRVIRVAVSVLETDVIQIRCNNTTQSFGGYSFGDDLSEVAQAHTRIFRASVIGRRQHPEIEFIKPTPGRMQILSITQEVSY